MSLFKAEIMSSNVSGIKSKTPKVVYATKKQTGKRISLEADRKRKAMPPGKRISKSGNRYYEGRKNRTDISGFNY